MAAPGSGCWSNRFIRWAQALSLQRFGVNRQASRPAEIWAKHGRRKNHLAKSGYRDQIGVTTPANLFPALCRYAARPNPAGFAFLGLGSPCQKTTRVTAANATAIRQGHTSPLNFQEIVRFCGLHVLAARHRAPNG